MELEDLPLGIYDEPEEYDYISWEWGP